MFFPLLVCIAIEAIKRASRDAHLGGDSAAGSTAPPSVSPLLSPGGAHAPVPLNYLYEELIAEGSDYER